MLNVIKHKLRLFLTGLVMGVADLVPGVSGGTIALLFGIYQQLIESIKLVTGKVLKLLLVGKFKQAYQLIPFGFFLPLGLGLLVAIFGFVHIISFLLTTQPILVWSFFFGLVLGSALVISRRITSWTLGRYVLALLGFVATFVIVGLPTGGGSTASLAIFLTGAIAITAMILPGMSGSLMMVILGQYEVMVSALAERNYVIMMIFTSGAILGLAVFVRVLSWIIRYYYMALIAFLVGVMFGSLRRIWPWQIGEEGVASINVLPSIDVYLLFALLLFIAGSSIVLVLEKVGIAKDNTRIT